MIHKMFIELHVHDFDKVRDFYGILGFKEVSRKHANNQEYLVMEKQGTIIAFWPGNGRVFEQSHFKQFPKDTPRGYGVEIVIPVDNVFDFYDEIKDLVSISSELKERAWGLWDFRIIDPFGYYIRITEHHNLLDPSYGNK